MKANAELNIVDSLGGNEFFVAKQGKLPGSLFPAPAWKRGLDLVCLLVCLPMALPLMAFIAILIKLVSTGPVFFRQKRVGYMGKPFTLFKFRTMTLGAATGIHQGHFVGLMKSNTPMKKIDLKDSRLIPFGLALRVLGLDELPQIINVFLGDMSLVGPRPCLPYEYENYLPWQKERFHALPGITGLWQVSGKNRTTFEEMMHLDIRYVHHKSFGMDLYILLMTIPSLIAQVRDVQREKRRQDTPAGKETPRRLLKNSFQTIRSFFNWIKI